MVKMAPSILAADFNRLGEQISEVERAGAEYLHIDVMDGSFVPSISFGMPVIESIRSQHDIIFDCHLMIERPERYIAEFARIGANIITVHYEACSDAAAVLGRIRELGCRAGLSINPETDAEKIYDLLPYADMILVMSVHPGFGGQTFIESSLDKIRRIRGRLNEMGLNTDIEVDGGINSANIASVVAAGANVIVSGSSVFRGDITSNLKKLRENCILEM